MKLFLTPEGGTELRLHDLGDVYMTGQQSAFSPDEFPQKETRTLSIRIEFNQDSYRDNYLLLQQVRAAVRKQNFLLKWQDEDDVDEFGNVLAPGEIYLIQSCTIAAQNVPETWGTYQQTIEMAFRFELFDLVNSSTHLQATFKKTSGSTTVTLGSVNTFKDDYRATRYSELRNIRDRASGVATLAGEFTTNPSDTPKNRRLALAAQLQTMQAQVNGKDGTLTWGPVDNRFFDKVVKVDSFMPEINQANFCIKWTMTVSYTAFPNESGYAAADFKVDVSQDDETGDVVMTLQGTVAAATEQIALAKLDAVRTASIAANGFTLARRLRTQVEKGNLNTDDTAGAIVFVALTFSETYRKRATSVLSFTFQQVDQDDTKSGILRRVYSGTVVASGATDTEAYLAAVAQAQVLGDDKHPHRLSSSITRADRQVNGAPRENVRVDFSYEYELKGERIYMEMVSTTTEENFGDSSESVSGFIVARDQASAEAAYQSQVRTAYNDRLMRGERTGSSRRLIENGTYGANWQGDGSFDEMWVRFEFEFSVHRTKATGFYAIKFGLDVTNDYVRLVKESQVEGQFFGSNTMLADIENDVPGNKLEAFFTGLGLGTSLRSTIRPGKEQLGDSIKQALSIGFSRQYVTALSSAAQLIECHVSEEITYSGVRWQFQDVPDGKSVPQDCGIKPGKRTVSGSVLAATEAVGMDWIKRQRLLPFPTGSGGGAAPADRFREPPTISRDFESLPLEDLTARGSGANARFVRLSFQFSETLPNYPYVET